MIIAIANQNDAARAAVAAHLARLRARSGHTVTLIDTAARTVSGRELVAELERLRSRRCDIVIDTAGRDSADNRAALIAARLAVVPLAPSQADLAGQYALIARLNAARMFNPGLRVLFVLVGDADASELAAVRAYVAHVMSATLAHTVLHAGANGDMESLYHEVFTH
ncbi:hypothetical protein [Duganella sp. LjRoot269]|jgi:chromosome partitioning protein|uniref:hypothetical protein n=1 Tax=Duganella sp. LjRoot269 TaxID=3342305 RepID=UPI003ED01FC0